MSEFNNLKLDVENEIAVLTISRPAALNALNSETLDELNTALTEIEGRDDIKVVILTGGPDKKDNAFKSFVAGADIAEMVNFTAPEARAFGIRASVPFFKLMNMRQVTIAAVNGFALGGGCEIAMACDIRIASDNAIFGQPECGLGIIPGFGGTQRLARLVGMGRAKEMIFTCDNIDANEAYRIGLVNKVVAKEELMERGAKLGADVPYCVMRGTALAEGIGEKLSKLPPMVKCPVLIAKPQISVSTKFVYDNLKLGSDMVHPDIDRLVADIREKDLYKIAADMGNVLETVTIPAYPVIADIKDHMMEHGAVNAMMSGSGPTVFGLFDKEATAVEAYEAMKASGLAKQVYLTSIYNNARK